MAPYSPVGARLQLSRDRGSEMNMMRLRGEGVDVVFNVNGERFPAHRFIVSIFSPYLKALVDPGLAFREAASQQIELKQVEAEHFGSLLTYMYTGRITVHDGNVFELLEMAQYLQLVNDDLARRCTDFLEAAIATCALNTFLRIWNVAEQCNSQQLRSAVLAVLEFRLEEFLPHDILLFLGYEEIQQVLSHERLCVRSEKALFDRLVDWIRRKSSADSYDEGDQQEMFRLSADLVAQLRLEHLPSEYVQRALSKPVAALVPRRTDLRERKCDKCVYFFEYSRDESDILGIQEFVDDRKNRTTFACVDPAADDGRIVSILRSPTQSKSYFQHYGPHSVRSFRLLASADAQRQILAVGGLVKTSKESVLSNEIRVLDAETATWEHAGGVLPKGMVQFGAVEHKNELYLVGGLSDEICFSRGRRAPPTTQTFLNKKLYVSRGLYKIGCGELTSLKAWTELESMPEERVDFSVAVVDDRIFVVGQGFCDVYDIASGHWSLIELPSGLGDLGKKPPALAAMGAALYVFGDRPAEGENTFLKLDTVSQTWTKLHSQPGMRLDVISAFVHNNQLYVVGWQRERKNVVIRYDASVGQWKCLAQCISGTLRPGALIRRQHLSEDFFSGAEKLYPERD